MFDFNIVQWIVNGLAGLWATIQGIGFDAVAAIIMLFPDPATMPGLPGTATLVLENAGFLAVLFDFNAINQFVVFMVQLQMTLLTIRAFKWIRSWV